MGIVFGLCCLWPLALGGLILLIVGFCLPSYDRVSRQCQYCGYQWPVL